MSRPVKWIVGLLGGVVGLVLLLVVAIYAVSAWKLNQTWEIHPRAVGVPADSATVARGEHVALIFGCTACHGEGLRGAVFIDEPAFGRFYAPNLTSGRGGVVDEYTVEDWVRTVRHGVTPSGRGVLFMPSQDFVDIGDRDIGALIAWIRTLPPIDNEPAFESSVGPIGRALYVAGPLPLVPAERIDHDTGPVAVPPVAETIAYGRYIGTTCRGCHGADYSGGPMPGAEPDSPQPPNLTSHPTGLAEWSEADFRRALREGVRPDGSAIDPTVMPIAVTAQMTDVEIGAIWEFLQSLPPLPTGS